MFRYFGTKASTRETVANMIGELTPGGSVADAFGGLGTVGSALRERGHTVTACDVLNFPHAFQIARLECSRVPRFSALEEVGLSSSREVLDALRAATRSRHWLVSEYADNRQFFTVENARRIAGAWSLVQRWNRAGLLVPREKAFLIASLLNSMDAVANTAGTYYAYLRTFHRKALRPFTFDWIPTSAGSPKGCALLGDAHSQLAGRQFATLYLDPPYNRRDYARYYHLPESLSLLSKPQINADSVAGVPTATHPSTALFHQGRTLDYIESLLGDVGWRYAVVHYGRGASIPLPELRRRLTRFGSVTESRMNALGYTTTDQTRSVVHHVYVVARRTQAIARANGSAGGTGAVRSRATRGAGS